MQTCFFDEGASGRDDSMSKGTEARQNLPFREPASVMG